VSSERQAAVDRVQEVEARSTQFRRELGLFDLVLTQILYVVGTAWVGTAAKLGTDSLVFWLLAATLYYLPQAAVVIYLSRMMPIEGGLYQWTAAAFGEFGGFLVAWNLWAYAILVVASFGVVIPTNLSYLIAELHPGFTPPAGYTLIVSVGMILGITVITIWGLRVGKWVQNLGGAAQFLSFGTLILVPFIALHRGAIAEYHPIAATVPAVSLLSLNIFGKMALGAFSGFEYVAILSGECRNPARLIGRSVVIAAPIIVLMFVLGTSSVIALVPVQKIDLVSPIPQALTVGFQGLSVARLIVPLLVLAIVMRQVGNSTLIFGGIARLPMVAGWDGLLPAWFTKLDPRFRTPVNSILVVGVVTIAFSVAGQFGVGLQEAFQLLENAAGIFYAFAYIALFAIPIWAADRLPERPPTWLRIASISGFAVSVLYSVLSVFPIIDVVSWRMFAVKIIAVLAGANVLGLMIYFLARRRSTVGAVTTVPRD
jgi:amino acid transporter